MASFIRQEHPTQSQSTPRVAHPGLALAVIAGAQLMVVLDITIVNIAIPHIMTALAFSSTGLAWVLDAYALAFGGLLLLGGRAGDILGRRRMFIVGVLLFAGASLLGGFATSEAWLIAARALQGVGAAIASPTALALVSTTFAEGPARNRAFGVYAAVAGAGSAMGLLLGGILTDALSWRWVFFVNVPIGILLATAAVYVLPRGDRMAGRFDIPGAVTGTAGVGLLSYGFIHAASDGWSNTATIVSFVLAAVLLAAFVAIEARSPQPLMPLRLFNRRSRWGSYLIMLSIGASLLPLFFFLTQFVQNILGFSAIQAGFAFLPLSATVIITAQVASILVPRVGVKALILPGSLLLTGGMFWLSTITVESTYVGLILPSMVVIAVGMGLLFVPVTLTAVSGVERRDAGIGSAMLNVQQQVGGTLGLAALVTVSTTATRNELQAQLARLGGALAPGSAVPGSAGTPAAPPGVLNEALVHGWAVGFEVAALFAVAGLIAGLFTLPRRTGISQEVQAEEPVMDTTGGPVGGEC